MSTNHVQRAWEECVVSDIKGSRIVHYYLRDSTANYILAVVGIERSKRHITYSVTEDFLRVCGATPAVNAGTRWKSRKAVVEYLRSICSGGGRIFDISSNTYMIRSGVGTMQSMCMIIEDILKLSDISLCCLLNLAEQL